LNGGLKYCTYLSFNVSRLLRYPKTEEPARRLTTSYLIEGPAWRLLLIKSKEPARRLTTSYFREGPAWRLLLIIKKPRNQLGGSQLCIWRLGGSE